MTLIDTKSEMSAAIDFLEPRIRGIEDIQKVGGSDKLNHLLNSKLYDLVQRRNLCASILSEIEKLLFTGYPNLPVISITPDLQEELRKLIQSAMLVHKQEIKDDEFVSNIFAPADAKATNITINLGTPVDNPR